VVYDAQIFNSDALSIYHMDGCICDNIRTSVLIVVAFDNSAVIASVKYSISEAVNMDIILTVLQKLAFGSTGEGVFENIIAAFVSLT